MMDQEPPAIGGARRKVLKGKILFTDQETIGKKKVLERLKSSDDDLVLKCMENLAITLKVDEMEERINWSDDSGVGNELSMSISNSSTEKEMADKVLIRSGGKLVVDVMPRKFADTIKNAVNVDGQMVIPKDQVIE